MRGIRPLCTWHRTYGPLDTSIPLAAFFCPLFVLGCVRECALLLRQGVGKVPSTSQGMFYYKVKREGPAADRPPKKVPLLRGGRSLCLPMGRAIDRALMTSEVVLLYAAVRAPQAAAAALLSTGIQELCRRTCKLVSASTYSSTLLLTVPPHVEMKRHAS